MSFYGLLFFNVSVLFVLRFSYCFVVFWNMLNGLMFINIEQFTKWKLKLPVEAKRYHCPLVLKQRKFEGSKVVCARQSDLFSTYFICCPLPALVVSVPFFFKVLFYFFFVYIFFSLSSRGKITRQSFIYWTK